MHGLLCPANTQRVGLVYKVLGVVLGRDTLDLGGLPVILSVWEIARIADRHTQSSPILRVQPTFQFSHGEGYR